MSRWCVTSASSATWRCDRASCVTWRWRRRSRQASRSSRAARCRCPSSWPRPRTKRSFAPRGWGRCDRAARPAGAPGPDRGGERMGRQPDRRGQWRRHGATMIGRVMMPRLLLATDGGERRCRRCLGDLTTLQASLHAADWPVATPSTGCCRSASTPESRPTSGASYRGPWRLPEPDSHRAGCPELVARLRHNNPPRRHGVQAAGRTADRARPRSAVVR